MPDATNIISLSLVSHTNVGKTTLARTLLSQSVGEVRDEPHVTDTYKSTNRSNFHLIWIIGIIIAILLYLREKKNKQRAMEYRQSSLLKDYPDIVSKLMIFIGAGLSIRQALEGIVSDYEGEGERRYAYEELAIAVDKLKNGVHESLVYKELGRVCALRQYMKLSSLLEQNRRSGLANLSSLLEIESQSAWDERIMSPLRTTGRT